MRPSDINAIFLGLVVALFTIAALIRLSPHQMKRIADWLNARADAEEWFEIRHRLYKRQRAEREGDGVELPAGYILKHEWER